MKPEDRLIYLCSRLKPNEVARREIQNILSTPLDWKRVTMLSKKHQVYQFLYYNFNRPELNNLIPEQILSQSKLAYYGTLSINLVLEKEWLRISDKAETENFSVIFFRGTSVIYNACNTLALRQMSDIDILVEPQDFPKLKNILLGMGYEQFEWEPWIKGEKLIFHFVKKTSKNLFIYIEPHLAIIPPRPYTIELPQLRERSIRANIGNKKISILSKEDLILSIALHLRRHTKDLILKFIIDIAEILNTSRNTLDWNYIINNARNNHMVSNLYLSLYLAKELLDAATPQEAMNRTKPAPLVEFLIKTTINKYNFLTLKIWNGFFIRLFIFDSFKDLIAYFWQMRLKTI